MEKVFEKEREEIKEIADGKSSKDMNLDERINVYKSYVGKAGTDAERLERINAYRCGW